MIAAYAEGMALAKKSGLKQQDLMQIIGISAIAAPMFQVRTLGKQKVEGKVQVYSICMS
jgi:3-hydroxyisobutyrate dehydrogenase-like beta-hydroxyacid dehydrogenase